MTHNISLTNVNAYYKNFQALKDVSLTMYGKQVTAFIGPSGCGKSTLLRTLNRMHEEVAGGRVTGQVRVNDLNIYDPRADRVGVRRNIGMVFQRPNPFPTMSIRDNVLAGFKLELRKHRPKKSERDELVERTLRQVNLWSEVKDRLSQPGMSLSGGQQQRLCIARAVAIQPEVLLMDEPCSALDPISTMAIEDLILELKEKFTIIMVTHNMQQAMRVSDYTAFFNLQEVGSPGELVEYGATRQLFANPEQKMTQDYVSGRFG